MTTATRNTRARILVLDDEQEMGAFLADLLTDEGYIVETYQRGESVITALEKGEADLLITDLVMKGMQGMEMLRTAKQRDPHLAIVMITAFGTIESAVEAMRLGAFYYLTKPFKAADLLLVVERALEERHLRTEVRRLQHEVEAHYHFDNMIGKSAAMQRIFALVHRLKDSTVNILLTGESGVGKDILARTLHYQSSRAQAPFVPVNCAAIPEQLLEAELFGYVQGAFTDARKDKKGLFTAAHHGTLFLDEVGELSLLLQTKLLRVIEDKEVRPVGATRGERVDVRIIAATNRDLLRSVRENIFRQDLYYRLNVMDIYLSPLRERPEDIPLFIQHFFTKSAQFSRARRFSADALRALLHYPWPGNVRELENVIERALVLCSGEEIMLDDLPTHVTGSKPQTATLHDALLHHRALSDIEREYILLALDFTEGKRKETAELLGIDRKTLYRKLEEYGRSGRSAGDPARRVTDAGDARTAI